MCGPSQIRSDATCAGRTTRGRRDMSYRLKGFLGAPYVGAPHYKLICPYLALFSKTFLYISLTMYVQAYNEGAPNKGPLTINMIQSTPNTSLTPYMKCISVYRNPDNNIPISPHAPKHTYTHTMLTYHPDIVY